MSDGTLPAVNEAKPKQLKAWSSNKGKKKVGVTHSPFASAPATMSNKVGVRRDVPQISLSPGTKGSRTSESGASQVSADKGTGRAASGLNPVNRALDYKHQSACNQNEHQKEHISRHVCWGGKRKKERRGSKGKRKGEVHDVEVTVQGQRDGSRRRESGGTEQQEHRRDNELGLRGS